MLRGAKDKALTEATVLEHSRQFLPPANAQTGADRAGTAEKRPRQGFARQASGRLDRAQQGVGIRSIFIVWSAIDLY